MLEKERLKKWEELTTLAQEINERELGPEVRRYWAQGRCHMAEEVARGDEKELLRGYNEVVGDFYSI